MQSLLTSSRLPGGQASRLRMLTECDFLGGARGRHHAAYKAGTNVVVLDPEVAAAFPDASSVIRALGLLLELAKGQLSNRWA